MSVFDRITGNANAMAAVAAAAAQNSLSVTPQEMAMNALAAHRLTQRPTVGHGDTVEGPCMELYYLQGYEVCEFKIHFTDPTDAADKALTAGPAMLPQTVYRTRGEAQQALKTQRRKAVRERMGKILDELTTLMFKHGVVDPPEMDATEALRKYMKDTAP